MPSRSAASKRHLGLLLMLVSGLCACSARTPARYDSEFLAMGTRVQLSLLAGDAGAAARVSGQIERTLLRQSIDWYPWTADEHGELRQLNAALARGQSQVVSPALRELLQRAVDFHARSDGYFDPAVKPLTEAWGFADLNGQPAPPAAALLEQWRKARPTVAALRFDQQNVSSSRHDLQLDLGAIAKGYALQLALQALQQLGYDNAMLNLGGQLAVIGADMARQLPAVAIRDPRTPSALAELRLRAGESISTSGDYQRYAQLDHHRIHHLLDPHTGLPVPHTQAVTVLSTDPTLADAASTALMAAGPDHWQVIARQLGIREVLRVDATGAIEVSAALYARLHWRPDIPRQRIRTVPL